MGKFNQLNQLGILLGLMCKYVCEDCDFRVFGGEVNGMHHQKVRVLINLPLIFPGGSN